MIQIVHNNKSVISFAFLARSSFCVPSIKTLLRETSTSRACGSSSPCHENCFPPSPQHQVFISSSRNRGPKEALGPGPSELQLFPGWFLFLVGQYAQLRAKAAARLPQNRIILLEGQCYTKAPLPPGCFSHVCWNETLWGILVISNPWEEAEAGRRERKEREELERMNIWKKRGEKPQPLFIMVQTLVLMA